MTRLLTAGIALFALMAVVRPAFSQQPEKPATKISAAASDAITLTFLGTGAPRPSRERHGASILVEAGKHKLLIDCGPEIRERIFQAGNFALLTNITDIFVTHLHYDHIADIDDVWIAGWMYGRRTPLHVWGPPGIDHFVHDISSAFAWDIRYREIVGIPPAGDKMEATVVKPGIVFDQDGLKITAFHVAHMPIDPATGKLGDLDGDTYGYRVDYRGHSVVFSGDLRDLPDSDLIKIGKGADVVVHEVQVPSPGNSPEAVRANVSLNVHSSPAQAGYAFNAIRPRMAVYSHIIPPQTTGEELNTLTRPYYKGPLVTAYDLMTLTIGDKIEIGKREDHSGSSFEASTAVQK